MNTNRTFGFALLLLAAAGSASADESTFTAKAHSDYELLLTKVHHLGYQGPVDTIDKPQPYADSTGGRSKAVADALGKASESLSVEGVEIISVVVQPDVN